MKLKKKEEAVFRTAFHYGITYAKSDKMALKILKLKNKLLKKMKGKSKKIVLDNDVIIKMIKKSTSEKDLGNRLNKYYKYLKQNKNGKN